MRQLDDEWKHQPVRSLVEKRRVERSPIGTAVRVALVGWGCVAILTFLITLVWTM